MIPDSAWSSAERRAICRISTSCSCTSDLVFCKPVSPTACWFRGVNLGAVMALFLYSSLPVSPAWREDTDWFKQPVKHCFLGSDLCSALEVCVKSYLLPWSTQEVSAKHCSNTTLVAILPPLPCLLSSLGAHHWLCAVSLQVILKAVDLLWSNGLAPCLDYSHWLAQEQDKTLLEITVRCSVTDKLWLLYKWANEKGWVP